MIVPAVMMGLFWMAGPADHASEAQQEILNRAEAAFQAGVKARGTPEEAKYFQKAAESYEILWQSGVHNPAICKNLGNANLLAGHWPEAILAFRRGLGLNANDYQMRANLAFARDQVVYSSADSFARPPESFWPPWLPRLTIGFTFFLVFIFYALAWFGLARGWTARIESRAWITWAGTAGAILFATIFMLQVQAEKSEVEHPVVVIASDQTYMLKGNHSLYPRAYDTPLNRGVEARLLQIRGDWIQIELDGGQVGWVAGENALVDLP
jgi:hypothetical protein